MTLADLLDRMGVRPEFFHTHNQWNVTITDELMHLNVDRYVQRAAADTIPADPGPDRAPTLTDHEEAHRAFLRFLDRPDTRPEPQREMFNEARQRHDALVREMEGEGETAQGAPEQGEGRGIPQTPNVVDWTPNLITTRQVQDQYNRLMARYYTPRVAGNAHITMTGVDT